MNIAGLLVILAVVAIYAFMFLKKRTSRYDNLIYYGTLLVLCVFMIVNHPLVGTLCTFMGAVVILMFHLDDLTRRELPQSILMVYVVFGLFALLMLLGMVELVVGRLF
ncbi:MAG: hypothetical protein IJ217_02475 [Clostridia bacterium]|nr:hypothetical protein [Clostridia bacterium]